jgi:hypothetical protein
MIGENDLIRRGDALNILRNAIIATARCDDFCRPVVRAQICSCIARIWATSANECVHQKQTSENGQEVSADDEWPDGFELERVLQEAAFVHGAQAFREMIARFVENGPATDPKALAGSIRANWVPGWGEDPGKLPGSIPYNAFGETIETDKLFDAPKSSDHPR